MSDSGREWRKVYRSITSSDRLASISDGAAWLYTLLLVSQDDEGRYPWTKAMVRTLTATRPDWSFDNTSDLLHELVDVELASIEDGLVILRRGSELNGIPRYSHDREPHQYPAPAVLRQAAAVGAAEAPLEVQQGSHGLKREEGEESSPPAGAHRARTRNFPPIDDTFIEEMVAEFSEQLGGEESVRQRIEDALNHTAMDKRKNKRLYLSGWLRRDAERRKNGDAQGHTPSHRASTDSWRGLPFADERAD